MAAMHPVVMFENTAVESSLTPIVGDGEVPLSLHKISGKIQLFTYREYRTYEDILVQTEITYVVKFVVKTLGLVLAVYNIHITIRNACLKKKRKENNWLRCGQK